MGRRGVTARVATNGSLLDADLLKRLRDETEVTSFQVSIDCLDPELYAELHGTAPGMLDQVLGTLRLMQQHGFHTTVSTRLAPATLPGIPALMDRCLQEGWSTLTVHIPVHTHRAEGAFAQDADALSTLEPAFEHFARMPSKWLVETYVPWAQYPPLMVRMADKVRIIHRGCRAGRDRLAVHPDGTISPCVCMDVPQARLGNVRQDDLADVFENSPLCQLLRHPLEHGLCEDCPHVTTCGGGCRAAAIALTGRFDGQDLSCPVRQLRAAVSEAACRGR
jgi:radical SAM protein with 4Fe4S-binding SPASM domain